jgi:hypothetical protein
MTRSKWGRHGHEENRDHHERDKKFANHRTEISQQTPPAGSRSFVAGVDSPATAPITGPANIRDPEEIPMRLHNAPNIPTLWLKISRTDVTTEKIERMPLSGCGRDDTVHSEIFDQLTV